MLMNWGHMDRSQLHETTRTWAHAAICKPRFELVRCGIQHREANSDTDMFIP